MAGIKGLFFTVDALLASLLILGVIVSASAFYVHEAQRQDISFSSKDLINVLSEITVGEISSSYIAAQIADGNITDLNNTLLEQLGVFFAEGYDHLAEELFENEVSPLIPSNLGIELWIDNNIIYIKNTSDKNIISSFRKFVSGIERDKPVDGYTSRIYLMGMDSRHTSAFTYFGGFVGQGNITSTLLLTDNITSIDEAYLELDISDDFSFYINSQKVADFIKGSGGGGTLVPDRWNIGAGNFTKFNGGENTIGILFDDLGYVAGGFLKVTYNTPEREDPETVYFGNNSASRRYNFPGISGIINLYDAFNVPGTLDSMFVNLHFYSEFPAYFTIGDTVVFTSNGSTSEQQVELTNMSEFPYALDFIEMSNSTVPIRFAAYNATIQNITGGDGDVILITDLSGSMAWQIGSWDSTNGVIRTCSDPDLYSESDSRRVSVAKCLDINFTDLIMDNDGNREWLVDFAYSASYFSSDPSDLTKANLVSKIQSYPNTPSGGTCLCCAINLAYNILDTFSSAERSKFVVVLTDGIPTYCCGRIGWFTCGNGTSTTPRAQSWSCSGGQTDCNTDDCDGPINSAIWSAERLMNDFDAKIFTVGMGPIATCDSANRTLSTIAEIGNGSSYLSQNASYLLSVFRNIAGNISAEINQSNQQITVKGDLTPAVLYSDSYIELNYTPVVAEPEYGRIPITVESERFANNISETSLFIPSEAQLETLFATSYSADTWTDNVSIYDGLAWHQAFSLSDTFVDYTRLGDPFNIMIPSNLFVPGTNNTILVKTGTSPSNESIASSWNRLIYTIRIKNNIGYSSVYAIAEGCNWTLLFSDGSTSTVLVPSSYNGTKKCDFASANYSTDDAIDVAMYTLLSNLDFDGDGDLAIKIGEDDLVLDSLAVSEVPSMWGPSTIDIRIWK